MSAILLDSKRIAQLADYITTLYNTGFDFFGYEMPEELKRELKDCRNIYGNMSNKKVFKRLYELNAAAVAGRYKTEETPAPDMPENFKPLHHIRNAGKDNTIPQWYEEIDKSHYELLKLLQCFIYQCEEENTSNTELLKGLKKIEYLMLINIASNQPEYIAAKWF